MSDWEQFNELSEEERQGNLDELQKWQESLKLAITNSELLYSHVFDDLHSFFESDVLNTNEFLETKQIINNFYTKAQRIEKKKIDKQKAKITQFDYEGIEENQEILEEVKQKLIIFNKLHFPLPFIINYFHMSRELNGVDWSIILNSSILDCINWCAIQNDIDVDNLPDASQFQLLQLLATQLEIIEIHKNNISNELKQIFSIINKKKWVQQLGDFAQSTELNQYLLTSAKILHNLSKLYESDKEELFQKTNIHGHLNLTKILFSICLNEQIPLPDILLQIEVPGIEETIKYYKTNSCLIKLSKKFHFLREIYRIPKVFEICVKHKLTPIEINQLVPHYLQVEYLNFLEIKQREFKSENLIQTQLKLLIDKFSSVKARIIHIYRDLRFKSLKIKILNIYSDWVNQYDGNLEGIPLIEAKIRKNDVQIALLIRHLEMMVSQEKWTGELLKFDYFFGKAYKQISNKDKRNFFFLKLFLIDTGQLMQPFPYFFEFCTFNQDTLSLAQKEHLPLEQFLYCPQVRRHFKEKYGYNFEFTEKNNIITCTQLPVLDLKTINQINTISWDRIFKNHLKLLLEFREDFTVEILHVVKSQRFKNLKKIVYQNQENRIFKLIKELEDFSQQKEMEIRKKTL